MSPSSHGALVQIAAPPGTGKTTVLPEMVALSRGEVIVDIDEILTDGSLLGIPIATAEAALIWPAYDQLWLQFAHIVRRAGIPVIMLVQVPDAAQLAVSHGHGGVLLGWEVPASVREERLVARGWDLQAIAEAGNDAAQLRRLLPEGHLITSPRGEAPGASAERLLRAAREIVAQATPRS